MTNDPPAKTRIYPGGEAQSRQIKTLLLNIDDVILKHIMTSQSRVVHPALLFIMRSPFTRRLSCESSLSVPGWWERV